MLSKSLITPWTINALHEMKQNGVYPREEQR